MHDSGLERAHIADLAAELDVPFGEIGEATMQRLANVLDPGLEPANPLDMWGASTKAQWQLTESLAALADDPAVEAVALAVDLVTEFDGDRSYPLALAGAARRTSKPLAVLANIPSAIDPAVAAELRERGHPGARRQPQRAARPASLAGAPGGRPARAAAASRRPGPAGPLGAGAARRADRSGTACRSCCRLRDRVARARAAATAKAALAAAAGIGYPVVLKTAEPGIAHKSDAGGVVLGIRDAAGLTAAYADLAARLGPRVLVCEMAGPGTELSAGIMADADLGPLVVVGAGGVLVEHLADRAVALPPVDTARRGDAVPAAGGGAAGRVPGPAAADLDAVVRAVAAFPRSPASWAASWRAWTSTR